MVLQVTLGLVVNQRKNSWVKRYVNHAVDPPLLKVTKFKVKNLKMYSDQKQNLKTYSMEYINFLVKRFLLE